MQIFKNRVKLRGFLAREAQVPESYMLTDQSYATLTLATASGVWDLGANQWHPRTDVHRIICPGPYFCGFVRGMRRGDYLEVKGELRMHQQERAVVVAGERFPVQQGSYAVYAVKITRLDRPAALVDYSDSDDNNEQQSSGEVQS